MDQPFLAALGQVDAGLDALLHDGLAPSDNGDCIATIEGIERCRRRLEAARAQLVDHIDRNGLHAHDGHASAKTMVRHVANLAGPEAAAVDKTAKAMRALPHQADGFRAGRVGVDQMRLVGRVNANPRVADHIAEHDDWFLDCATSMPFVDFEAVVRQWERLVDVDGARDRNERNHRARDFRFGQDPFDLSWSATARFGALQGAAVNEVFLRYEKAEWDADWEKARAEHGDDACYADLPRDPAQRRADAFWQMAQDAAGAPGSPATDLVHDIVWSSESFEAMLASLATGESPRFDPRTHCCSTIDGISLEPTEAASTVFVAKMRRVVTDAAGTVIDLGRARRFTGSARHAAQLQSTACVWPGCHRPTSQCEIDHLTEHSRRGSTCPGNGAPLCGRHNRWKQRGFSVWRDPTGHWHTARPDGTEID